jgi:predicted MFS family arabinose efflux permease
MVQFARDEGHSEADAERLLVHLAVGSLTLRVPLTYLADRCGRWLVFTVVLLAYASADVAVVLLSAHYGVWRVYAVLIGAMVGCLLSVMSTLPAEVVEEEEQLATATTMVCSCLGIGTASGPMIAGAIYDAAGVYDWGFVLAASMLLGSALALNTPCGCGVGAAAAKAKKEGVRP